MKRIGIIYGSSRPSKAGQQVANWFARQTESDEFEYEMIDLKELNLPLLDEPATPMQGQYSKDHTFKWSEQISKLDGFIIIPAVYNGGYTAILKNALDFLYKEWGGKPVGFVSYASGETSTAVEQLGLVVKKLQMKQVEPSLNISRIYSAFDETGQLDESLIFGSQPKEIIGAVLGGGVK